MDANDILWDIKINGLNMASLMGNDLKNSLNNFHSNFRLELHSVARHASSLLLLTTRFQSILEKLTHDVSME